MSSSRAYRKISNGVGVFSIVRGADRGVGEPRPATRGFVAAGTAVFSTVGVGWRGSAGAAIAASGADTSELQTPNRNTPNILNGASRSGDTDIVKLASSAPSSRTIVSLASSVESVL